MIRRGLLLGLLGALALPASAGAVMFPGSPQPYQRWADEAHVPTVAGSVDLIEAHCPNRPEPACTSPIDALYFNGPWMLATEVSVSEVRLVLLHELGHRFDYVMPEWVRVRFSAIMRDTRSWRTTANSTHEQFAEAYSLCALGGATARAIGFGGYDYWPTVRQRRTTCRLIRGLRFPGLRRSP